MMLTQLQLLEVTVETPPAPRDMERERRLHGVLTEIALADEEGLYGRTHGARRGDRPQGFVPGFRNEVTGELARSRYADGAPAPMHLLDGLPEHWVAERDPEGRVTRARPGVVSGFLRDGRFYTRDQAAQVAAH